MPTSGAYRQNYKGTIMNDSENEKSLLPINDNDVLNFDELESKLEEELNSHMEDLKVLQDDYEKIENPGTIGEVVGNVVWEQFINQIGNVAGEEFIRENRGLKLDLRNSAHIQTTENFNHGIFDNKDPKLATHNPYVNYEERHKDWENNFQKNEDGTIKTKFNRTTGKTEPVLRVKKSGKEDYNHSFEARAYIDKGREIGSASVNKDHTVSAKEIICDPETNAHMTREEHHNFANDKVNLVDLDASANMSKGQNPMGDWLDSERDGKKPAERFNINEKELRERDEKARIEYEKRKKEGEQRSIETGKQSQKEEAFRIGGKALQAVLMGLLAALIKDVIRGLIAWFRSAEKNIKTFLNSLKQSVVDFFSNLKEHLKTAGKTFLNTIMTAIWGPIVGTINKAIIFLKQGYKSFKEAIQYLKDPQNREKPFSIKLLQVGKIITAGLVAGGAILLGEAIEKGLMNIPGFAFPIPMLGSLASLLGIFFGALISGIIGALALRELDKAIANKQKKANEAQQAEKMNDIVKTQDKLIKIGTEQTTLARTQTAQNITGRHQGVNDIIQQDVLTKANKNNEKSDEMHKKSTNILDEINSTL